jgi:hypothetical protein
MTALAILEHVDLCQHYRLCLFVRVTILQIAPCGFAGRPAALGPGVVPTVALATPTRLHPRLRQALSIALSPLLTATVRRHA